MWRGGVHATINDLTSRKASCSDVAVEDGGLGRCLTVGGKNISGRCDIILRKQSRAGITPGAFFFFFFFLVF